MGKLGEILWCGLVRRPKVFFRWPHIIVSLWEGQGCCFLGKVFGLQDLLPRLLSLHRQLLGHILTIDNLN